ncbi:MAG TPA: indole-3-glycerol phosphate synthase TrpC [Terriglobia bacterium]|nr:indole-3-glycerol phosphate synthase TrpC [Terriglobia bacterium]
MNMKNLEGTVLGKIVARRRLKIEQSKDQVPLSVLRADAERRIDIHDFTAGLRGKRLGIIAELKKASPSRGLLCSDYRCQEIALQYERAGANALSVLTEEEFFLGSLDDLEGVRAVTHMPLLRKDFILDPYQVYECAARGADALLLIVAALSNKELASLLQLAEELRMAALVEVHTEEEITTALEAGATVLGVNNRNLKTLEVSLETSFRLVEKIPPDCLKISESGIKTPSDLIVLHKAGFDAVLIGEHFMMQQNPGAALAGLLEGVKAEAVDERR